MSRALAGLADDIAAMLAQSGTPPRES